MKIAVFAAVPEEVGRMSHVVNFTGIGREQATQAALNFLDRHRDEIFTVVNVGTVGAHTLPVGSLLSIREVTSAGRIFHPQPMLLDHLSYPCTADLPSAILYSSDSFVSPKVYCADHLKEISGNADCFDMESSSLFSIMNHFGKPYVSFKIVSDHLDVDIEEWRRRVHTLSQNLADFMEKLFSEIGEKEPVEFLKA